MNRTNLLESLSSGIRRHVLESLSHPEQIRTLIANLFGIASDTDIAARDRIAAARLILDWIGRPDADGAGSRTNPVSLYTGPDARIVIGPVRSGPDAGADAGSDVGADGGAGTGGDAGAPLCGGDGASRGREEREPLPSLPPYANGVTHGSPTKDKSPATKNKSKGTPVSSDSCGSHIEDLSPVGGESSEPVKPEFRKLR